jgi:eukaryotic-like serine/threonine-protein kinase
MHISPEKWEAVKALFDAALELEAPEREAFLRAKSTDDSVRAEVERLLAEYDEAGTFLSDPALAGAALRGKPQAKRFSEGEILAERFKILRFVAEGGMGEVYEAEDLELRERVALKTLRLETLQQSSALARFKREVYLARKVTHPNVCRIFDLYRHRLEGSEEVVIVSMEFLLGETLAERIKRMGRLGMADALPLISQMASALGAAHDAGIVHRDFKPSNVVLVNEPAGTRAVVTDFGLAFRGSTAPGQQSLTEDSWLLTPGEGRNLYGTPAYMSPEQIEGQSATSASDIYAFGLVIYEMLAGVRPFQGETPISTAAKRLAQAAPSPRTFEPSLSAECESAILRCLEREPAKRFAKAQDVVKALEGGASSAVGAQFQPEARATRSRRQRISRRWLFVAGLAMLVLALVGGAYLRRARQSPKLTEKDSIVLADFTNTTGDTVFDDALRQGLAVQLEQSPFLSLVSEERIQQTLRLMGHSPGTRLTPQIARDLCQRTGGAAVLNGSIENLGAQYILGIKAVNCRTGDSLAEEQSRAVGKEHVLEAMDKAASTLRAKLGESLATLDKFDTPVEQATTPSLEALQAFSLGWTMIGKADRASAVPLLRRAIRLDPNFAMAYAVLGTSYAVLGEAGLSAENTRRAYELRARVSEREKFYIESHYEDFVNGDPGKARQIYELWVKTYPRDALPLHILCSVNHVLGQFDKGLAAAREALRLDPNSASNYNLVVASYLALNRLKEAQAVADEAQSRGFDSPYLRFSLYDLAFLRNDAAGMAQQVAWSNDKPGVEDVLLEAEGETAAYFGRLRKANEFTRRAMASAERVEERETAANYEADSAVQEAFFGKRAKARERAGAALALSNGRDVEFEAALSLADVGDTRRAQTLAADLAKRFPRNTLVQFNYVPTIQAEIALSQNSPAKAIEALRGAAPYELGLAESFPVWISLYPVYVRGKAYLANRQATEAVAEFQKILDHRGVVFNEPIGALAHLQLARAYALQGDRARARAKYRYFLALWKDADHGIPIFEEADFEYSNLH